jgi:hypothetical protein
MYSFDENIIQCPSFTKLTSAIDKHMFMTITVIINLGDFSFPDAIESTG